MEVKMFELRDKGTFIPIVCVKLTPSLESTEENKATQYLLRRAGWQVQNDQIGLLMMRVDGYVSGQSALHEFYDRTYQVAHRYIDTEWYELKDGDVIDVEFILGETLTKKKSERFDEGGGL